MRPLFTIFALLALSLPAAAQTTQTTPAPSTSPPVALLPLYSGSVKVALLGPGTARFVLHVLPGQLNGQGHKFITGLEGVTNIQFEIQDAYGDETKSQPVGVSNVCGSEVDLGPGRSHTVVITLTLGPMVAGQVGRLVDWSWRQTETP